MQAAAPNECEKYKLHVEEMDKITSLIFGLSGRLAKAENALLLCVANDVDTQKDKVRIINTFYLN